MLRRFFILISLLCILLMLPILAQEKIKGNSEIESAIESKNFVTADSLIEINILTFIGAKNYDTLLSFIPLKGMVVYKQAGAQKAISAVYSFIDRIKIYDSSSLFMTGACRQAAEFFGSIGQNNEAYNITSKELAYTQQLQGDNTLKIASCEYNMGVYAQRLANISLSVIHYRKALLLRETLNAPPEDIYSSYNSIASCMWYASKYDSATIFYNKALDIVKKMPDSLAIKNFRLGILENNIAGLYSTVGQFSNAISAQQSAINYYQQFVSQKKPHPKKYEGVVGLLQAIDNLAGLYKEIGDYGKAGDLLNYAYQQKLKRLNPDEPDIFFSEILLGQHYNDVREYDKSLQYLLSGLQKLEQSGGDYLFWQADANYGLALAYENKKKFALARDCYNKSDSLYEISYQGDYDNTRMDFSRNASLFFAKNGDAGKALKIANELLSYLQKVNGETSLQAFYQLTNIAAIELIDGKYQQTISFSNKALNLLDKIINDGMNRLDSVKMEVQKPKAILLNAKASYFLTSNKDSVFLGMLSEKLNNALQILEKRKVLIDDPESISILIAENNELIEFAKKIELELFQLTHNEAKLNRFIDLHESGIYNRIRSRLDKEKAIRFANLPEAIQKEEQELKAAIPASLQGNQGGKSQINDYINAVNRWKSHVEKVKIQYPVYYKMRYGPVFKSLSELQTSTPSGTTVIRFIFTGDQLSALIVDSSNKELVPLNSENLESDINSLLSKNTSEKDQLETLNRLYQNLWAPLNKNIHTKKLVIIPDGILYNLPFDMLTPTPVVSYRQLAHSSLLNKYIINYHYSLFMLQNKSSDDSKMENYIAFAPGFFDKEKNGYVQAVNDSVKLDYQYLSLLPQPNTSKLTKKLKEQLGGSIYLNNASTTRSFRQNATGHKIIHIGTHAVYNNQDPEKSRLIFSKTNDDPEESNSLFLADIYNCSIQSGLTILTACESGKPGYQDGEGMVSLAHAFNYAGSKSILTGLWNIDEQSSNMITAYFVDNLSEGVPTDEALQKAKLQYLQHAEGRMLAPAYWAGLVLMGEPTIIKLDKPINYNLYLYIAGILLLVSTLLYFYFKRKKSHTGSTF